MRKRRKKNKDVSYVDVFVYSKKKGQTLVFSSSATVFSNYFFVSPKHETDFFSFFATRHHSIGIC